MKIAEQVHRSISTQELASVRMRIDDTSKTADTLMSKLYSNPIKAFIRELGTNAYEAHQMVGKENTPFLVSLENRNTPTFTIRDFGPGLSFEEVRDIYTVIGRSTKTNTNEVGGCFGLGSKSVLAYTQQFSVTSVYQGKKSIYIVHRGEDGFIRMTMVLSEDTEEESGITISIPIQSDDISRVESYCVQVYSYFDTIPDVKFWGKKPIIQPPYTKKELYTKCIHGSIIQMGNIAYPFPLEIVDKFGLVQVYARIPIGDLEPTPSREEFVLSKKTLDYCKNLAENIIKDANDKLALRKQTFWECFNDPSIEFPCKKELISVDGKTFSAINHKDLEFIQFSYSRKTKNISCLYPSCGYQVNFYLVDKKTGWKPLIKKHILSCQNTPAAVICFDKNPQKLLDIFGKVDIIRTSTFSPLPKGKSKLQKFNERVYQYSGRKWVVCEKYPTTPQWYCTKDYDPYYYNLFSHLGYTVYKCNSSPPQGWLDIDKDVDKLKEYKSILKAIKNENTRNSLGEKRCMVEKLSKIKSLELKLPTSTYHYSYRFIKNKEVDQDLLDKVKELYNQCPYLQYFSTETPLSTLEEYINDCYANK